MKLVSLLSLVTFYSFVACAAGHPLAKPKKVMHYYTLNYENILGTSMELKIAAELHQEANIAEKNALLEIDRLSKILSGYDPESEFMRWQKTLGHPVHVSNELFEVMKLFDDWHRTTQGAIDASAEVISRLWKKAGIGQQLPSPQDLANAVAEIQQPHWELNELKHTATHLNNAPLILNSFAKSYIIKHAVDAAMASGGIEGVMMNIGGDLVVAGDMTENVFISDPKADAENEPPIDQVRVRNRAVATSGNYRRGVLINGHWYSHIVDPRTGLPADDIISATVVAPLATDAGALATAFNVLTVSESIKLMASFPEAEYLIITKDGKKISSSGWNKLEVPAKKAAEQVHQSSDRKSETLWTGDFELIISLEINVQHEGRVKRPYVAVWIEDENHAPVRTISVWHESDRYMPELKSWYLKYRGKYNGDKDFNSSVTSATRPAGKYTVKWDGKDDQGNIVKPGKYIVKIEAAREHGTYQLMRQEIVCDDQPKQVTLPGNIEISSASLDYKKNK